MTHPLHAELTQGLSALGLPLSPETEQRLLDYLDLIARWNKVYNLTAVPSPGHAAPASAGLPGRRALAGPCRCRARAGAAPWRILDVGSGAGLPGVVLAIVRPQWQVSCVDTVAKKASFIRQVGWSWACPTFRPCISGSKPWTRRRST
jgi:16S rRNA (guanine527-N7)-methyltransferase